MLSVLNNIKIKTLCDMMAGFLVIAAVGALGMTIITATEVNNLEAGAADGSIATASSFVVFSGTVAVLLLAAMVAFFFWFSRARVVRPLTKLDGCMSDLAAGNNDVEIPGLEQSDEIGDMARSVQVFKENAKERDRLVEEQDQDRGNSEQRSARMADLTTAFDKQASGIVSAVAGAADQIRSTAESMSTAVEDAKRRASTVATASEQATANVQTVASASEEMSASINEINRQAMQSTDIAAKAKNEAERTNETVQGLAERAQKIGQVVDLITEIAEQTNLLALNATIEAARAGEAGKGFAVVASEVKSLATQTAKATEEIGAQIRDMQTVTGEVVAVIKKVGETIGEVNEISASIASAMSEQDNATQEIAENTQQAAIGTQEVSNNINGVTQATSDTGVAAQDVLGAAAELSKQSETLRDEIETFLKQVRAA
ncbi:MAG: methyl-accepting chemotaxis protein [Alphaproteobacteria bacterium]|nr:methyl-accepting chemotaxis protein [Alphaproteobacteria bacterium]